MTITQALSNANSGLAAAGRQAGVASNNIANALTEGYSRRDVSLVERSAGGVGGGVAVAGVTRAANPAITLERRGAEAELARYDAQSTALARISNTLGGPDDPNSLFQKYQNFETALRSLADSPDSAALLQGGVTAAKDLTASFNKLANGFQQVRLEADQEIYARVQEVNTALGQIEDLNNSILRTVTTGGDASALMDQRQRLIDSVNESIPVRELRRENGVVDLMTHEGVFLLAGTARTIQFSPATVMTAQQEYNDGAGALSGLTVDGVDITPTGSSSTALAQGALSGLFSVRDEIAPEMSLALDALALDLAERFSEPGLDPTLTAGAPGLFTDAGVLADSANLAGLAGRLRVNAAVDPALGGDPQRLRDGLGATAPGPAGSDVLLRDLIGAMTDPRTPNPALQTGQALSASEGAAHLASIAGAARLGAASKFETAEILAGNLIEAEQLQTGVDTDRELQNLLLLERAYAANARVIQIIDEMIDRLMEAVS